MHSSFPTFRSDVEIIPRLTRGKPAGFVVKDPLTERVYEIGEEEHFLCQQFDGVTPLATIRSRFESRFGIPLRLEDLEAFRDQMASQGLLVGTTPPTSREAVPEIFDVLSAIPKIKWEFLDGDRLFGWLAPHLDWMFTRLVKRFSVALILSATYVLLSNWPDYWDAIVANQSLSWLELVLALSITCTQPLRALAHGMACKHFGGSVGGVGIVMVWYCYPGLYIDWGSYVMLREKWKRCWTVFAGIFIQLHVWAVATIGWRLTTPETSANTIWLALSFITALGLICFAGNPLLTADGQLTLTTWLEIPQLRQRALAAFWAWMGRQPAPEPLTRRERQWFIFYGALCLFYTSGVMVLILWTLGLGLTEAFQGGGAIATVVVGLLIIQKPLGRYLVDLPPVKWFLAKDAGHRRRIVRLGLLGLLLGVSFVPYPYETGGPFSLLPVLQMEIHSEIDGGRIEQVVVSEGDFVNVGQPLAQIDRREFEKDLQATQAQLDDTEAKLRLLRKQLAILDQPPNIEQIQSLEAEARRLRTLVVDYQRQLNLTTLRAPMRGRIATPRVEERVGQYLKKGDLFAVIEQMEAVRVEIQVPESDAPLVQLGKQVKVVSWAYPGETFYGTIKEIAPIAAMPTGSKINSVRVIAELSNKDLRFKSQITGYAKIKTGWTPVWRVIFRPLIRWFQVQVWYWWP